MRIIISVLFIASVFLFSGCEEIIDKYKIEYEITGDATFATYYGPDGDISDSSISTPWSYSFRTSYEEQIIKLSAGSDSSTVYIKVFLDGRQILSDSESDGLTAISGTYMISDFL